MTTTTKVLDIRIIETLGEPGGWSGLYVGGRLYFENGAISLRDMVGAAAGNPATVRYGLMKLSDADWEDDGFDFPENISELDGREEGFRVEWDDRHSRVRRKT